MERRAQFARGDALARRFQFVADHSATFEVRRLCELVEIDRSSYYAWMIRAAPARAARDARDAALAERIRAIHTTDDTVGAPRVTAELNDGVPDGERINHKRVARVMRSAGIAASDLGQARNLGRERRAHAQGRSGTHGRVRRSHFKRRRQGRAFPSNLLSSTAPPTLDPCTT